MNFLKKLMNNRQNKSFQGETGERNRAESTLRGELNQSKGYKLGLHTAIWKVILKLLYRHRHTQTIHRQKNPFCLGDQASDYAFGYDPTGRSKLRPGRPARQKRYAS